MSKEEDRLDVSPLLIVQIEPPQNEGGGDFHYRTHGPCAAMAAQDGVHVVTLSNIHRRREEILRRADVLILKDVCDADLLPLISERKAGKRLTVYELDDDIAAIPPGAPCTSSMATQKTWPCP